MLLLNIDHVPGKEIEALGLVKGTVVQSKNFGRDFMAGMKTLVGGEITSYTEMLVEARQIATKRMVDEANAMGADAVINIRFGSSAVMQGAAEVVASGPAVKLTEEKGQHGGCPWSLSKNRSLRTSPQTGVAIPRLDVPLFVDKFRKTVQKNGLYDDGLPIIRWRFPHQCAHWFGMTCSDGPTNSNLPATERYRAGGAARSESKS